MYIAEKAWLRSSANGKFRRTTTLRDAGHVVLLSIGERAPHTLPALKESATFLFNPVPFKTLPATRAPT